MSQSGQINTVNAPTQFQADDGTANPALDVINIVGGQNVQTSGSSSTVTIKAIQEVTSKTGAYTSGDDDYFINCTANSFTVDLPSTSGRTGKIYQVKNSGAGVVTIDGNGSEQIDGEATQQIFADESLTLISDGSNWFII